MSVYENVPLVELESELRRYALSWPTIVIAGVALRGATSAWSGSKGYEAVATLSGLSKGTEATSELHVYPDVCTVVSTTPGFPFTSTFEIPSRGRTPAVA